MGTETISSGALYSHTSINIVKLNKPLMGTETPFLYVSGGRVFLLLLLN